MKLLKTRTLYFRSTCAIFSGNSWSSSFSPSLLFFSSFTSLLCCQKTPINSLLIGNKCLRRLVNFAKVSVVDSLRFFVAGLKNGLFASVVISAKEHKKSLNAEVKVESKSCGTLFELILISIIVQLY